MYRYIVDFPLYYRFLAFGIGSDVLYRIWPENVSSLFDFFVQKKFDSRLWYIGIGSAFLYRIWSVNLSSLFCPKEVLFSEIQTFVAVVVTVVVCY